MPNAEQLIFLQKLSKVIGKCKFCQNAATITTASVTIELAIAACIQHQTWYFALLQFEHLEV